MALRELKKGEKVLMIEACPNGKVGDTVIVLRQRNKNSSTWQCKWNKGEIDKYRESLLAIGDKVTRGPDWGYGDQDGGKDNVGVITHILKDHGGQTCRAKWPKPHPSGSNPYYRMNADYQDLKPVGDSEVGEGKPECFGEYMFECSFCSGCKHKTKESTCRCIVDCRAKDACKKLVKEKIAEPNKPKPIEENDMANRSARKRELKEVLIPAKEDALEDAKLALAKDQAELQRLVVHTTDHAETIADIKVAHKMDDKQAEAALRLSKKDIVIS